MAIFETVLKSDLKKPVQVKQLSGNLFSGDNQGNKITVEVMDNGSPASLSGDVKGYIIREDNITVEVDGTLSENKASIIFPQEAYNVVGKVCIAVKVDDITVGACTAYVYRTTTDSLIDSSDWIPSLAEIEAAAVGANKVANLTVSAEAAIGSTPDAVLSETGTGSSAHKHITFKLVKGDKGDKGDTGETPQLSIGTVTTLQPSQEATATLTGTDAAPVLNLGIPKGPSGNESIDDTAGLGDTDLVYSADKVVKLFRSEHEDLTSGNAEQVIGKVASTEKGAYLYRRGMHLGNRCREKLVGGTIAWNQLANIAGSSRTKTENNVTYTDNRDGSYTVSTTEQGASPAVTISITPTVKIQGHKVLYYGMPESSVEGLKFMCGWAGTRIAKSGIYSVTNASEAFSIVVENGTVISTAVKVVPQFFDLTAMFGSVIADTLYGMGEAGVAWFRERFSKDYYAYDAGELMSVQAASKVIKDANNNTVHTYPFDTSLTLRGIPKLDSNNRLYYDGDEYESSGKVTRKYGIVDLGTLTWEYKPASGHERFAVTTTIPNIKYKTDVSKHNNIICEIYQEATGNDIYHHVVNKSVGINDIGQVVIYDSSAGTDAGAFKTAMSGVYLVYELATPATESADPFTPIMSFDPKGTEEFTEWGTRDVAIPVGHITEYLTDPAKILNNIPLIEVEKESASVVAFSDGAEGLPLKELTVKVEPVQDLHGQANPYQAGGSKNLLPWTSADTTKAINGITYTKLVDDAGNFIGIDCHGTATGNTDFWFATLPSALESNSYYFTTGLTTEVTGLQMVVAPAYSAVKTSNTMNTSVSGCYMSVTNGTTLNHVKVTPMICLASESDKSFTPYSNICPISGWTGANVQIEQGKNFLPVTKKVYSDSNIILTLQDTGYFHVYHTRNTFDIVVFGKVLLKNGQKIKLTKINAASSNNLIVGVGRTIGTSEYSNSWMNISGEFTIAETGEYYIWVNVYGSYDIDVGIGIFFSDSISDNNSFTGPIINGNALYSITFPTSAGTVYGGTVKVEKDGTGKLTIEKVAQDLGQLTWANPAYTAFYVNPSFAVGQTEDIICSNYKYNGEKAIANIENAADKNLWRSSDGNNIFIKDTTYADGASFKAAMSGVQLVYPLATPIVYDLSPVEVTTLLGINNVWADTGDTALTYRADTKLYIDKKFAELSAAITALGT